MQALQDQSDVQSSMYADSLGKLDTKRNPPNSLETRHMVWRRDLHELDRRVTLKVVQCQVPI